MTKQAISSPQRILVRGLNWLGDAVMGTAALQRLREANPRSQITLLTHEKLASLWEHQPFVDDVIAFSSGQSPWKTAKILREQKFDVAVAFPNSIRSAMELWLAGIPRRIGYARPWRTFLFTDPVAPRSEAIPMRKRSEREVRHLVSTSQAGSCPIPSSAHHVHDYLRLVAQLGASPIPLPPQILVTEKELEETRDRLGIDLMADERPWFGLNPGAEYGPAKRWPAERFVKAAVELHRQTGCRWVLFGGAADIPVAEQMAEAIQSGAGRATPITLNIAGKTSLRQLAAALKLCRLVITNDTGPMHLASAVGTPVIVPFGSTSPEMTGPTFSTNAQILKATAPCSPCFQRICPIDFRCMNGIESDAVVQAAARVLRRLRS